MANLASGRVRQKMRTRDQLVASTIKMVREGRLPTVAEVADEAGVGRTTAYRYFPTAESLLAEAVLSLVGEPDDRSLYKYLDETDDIEERLDAVIATSEASICEHLAEYRAMLRLSLAPALQGERLDLERPGYRRKWLTDALKPLRSTLRKGEIEYLVSALSLCVGIEATITLRDVCRLDEKTAVTVKRRAAKAILREVLGTPRYIGLKGAGSNATKK